MSVFGWCSDGFHEGRDYRYGTPCPGRVGTGQTCDCECHQRPQGEGEAA